MRLYPEQDNYGDQKAHRSMMPPPQTKSPPYSVVVGLACAVLVLPLATGPLRDPDIYWHLLAGAELSSGVPADSLGLEWSFAPNPLPWTSTQWFSELLLHLIHGAGSWTGLAVFTVLTAAASVALLSRSTLRGRPIPVAVFPFILAAIAVVLMSQERPQQFTLIGAAALSGLLVPGLETGRMPRWWLVLPLTILWANLHGGWVLVPVVLGMIGLGRFVDHGVRDRPGAEALLLVLLTLGAGALTPSGVAGVFAFLRFTGATDHLVEWQPTIPYSVPGSFTVLMLLFFIIGWLRPPRVPGSEAIVVLILLIFSWSAWRNMTPGLVLLAPLAAQRLTHAFPGLSHRAEPSWSAPTGIAIAVVALVAGLGATYDGDHLPIDQKPIGLASAIGELDPGQRVLNDYNVAGLVLYFGGMSTQVAIDGRADRYDPDFVASYTDMMVLKGDWEGLLTNLAANSALLEKDSALAQVLQRERDWTRLDQDATYVLLRAP